MRCVRPIYTIGHSTRPWVDFVELLHAYEIKLLCDVRTIPKSRRYPQFNQEAMAKNLKKEDITYVHMKGLGGLRHPSKDSINKGWRNDSFRGYADYMQTPDFKDNLKEFLHLSCHKRTVIMCAEAVPWRCHRSMIGDALIAQGIEVLNIMSTTNAPTHRLNPMAKIADDHRIFYPPAQDTFLP